MHWLIYQMGRLPHMHYCCNTWLSPVITPGWMACVPPPVWSICTKKYLWDHYFISQQLPWGVQDAALQEMITVSFSLLLLGLWEPWKSASFPYSLQGNSDRQSAWVSSSRKKSLASFLVSVGYNSSLPFLWGVLPPLLWWSAHIIPGWGTGCPISWVTLSPILYLRAILG